MNPTKDLKQDHLTLRRVRDVAQKCADKLYANDNIPFEDLEIISVVIEEFVDRFHHGKEEQAYFPETKDKDSFSEDVRKFLIEHELGRRIARMFLRNLKAWKDGGGTDLREPVARFLKSYALFISDHTGKEDIFFDMIEEKHSMSNEENGILMKRFESCRNEVGGEARIEQMMKLIEYLEAREWMK
ncbi:MAG: hemerythrin domain-containing protein [Candidatus Nitrosopolaris sp.]